MVPLTRRVHAYNVRLTDPDAVTTARVRGQAQHLGLDDADVLFLGGRPYGTLIQEALPNSVAPLSGHGGMGHQLHILKAWASPSAEGERQRSHLWHEATRQGDPAGEVPPTPLNSVDTRTHIR